MKQHSQKNYKAPVNLVASPERGYVSVEEFERVKKERNELLKALVPFFCPDWTNDKGWTDSIGKDDKIWSLFGPSDFHNVQSLVKNIMKWGS